jgi:50S ribosomal protein L16 3-hydroxylase
VKLALKSIMLYQGKHVFINGEAFNVTAKDKTLLAKLADQRP